MTERWPYSLPIFRRAHRASSPDGKSVAEIERTVEVSMGNPTQGTLTLSSGLVLGRCSPSFVWSSDSRYLAVPQFFAKFGFFRRQRMIVVDTLERRVLASPESAYYFQPESFSEGVLVATREPFHTAIPITWRIPAQLERFKLLDAAWSAVAQPGAAADER